MSLATYAAPFNEDNINNKNNKSKSHCKVNTEKVNTLLSKIHDKINDNGNNRIEIMPIFLSQNFGLNNII